jgi:hypothetical protein
VPGRAAVAAGPGGRVAAEHAAGRQPDQQVRRLPRQGGGQRGGADPAWRITSRTGSTPTVPPCPRLPRRAPRPPPGTARTSPTASAWSGSPPGPRNRPVVAGRRDASDRLRGDGPLTGRRHRNRPRARQHAAQVASQLRVRSECLADRDPQRRLQVRVTGVSGQVRDRDARERGTEILDNLALLVGPRAPEGSPLIRSITAFGHARVYLLGKAGVLMDDGEDGPAASVPDSGDGQADETDLIALLARGYGVAANLFPVAEAISERVIYHPTQEERSATLPVLGGLLRKPGIVARLRRGEDPFGSADRKALMIMVRGWRPRPSAAEFVDGVVEEVRSTLLRVSGHIVGE